MTDPKDRCANAIQETQAQLAVLRALQPLTEDAQQRVLEALGHLLEADRLVPGILDAAVVGLRGRVILDEMAEAGITSK